MNIRVNRRIVGSILVILGLFLVFGAFAQFFSHNTATLAYFALGGVVSCWFGLFLIRGRFPF